MTLYFYIDKAHFPYSFQDNLSLDNKDLIKAAAPSTWLSWTLMTYLQLREIYDCRLVDTLPQEGIILFFRGSMPMNQKPNDRQFWVCMAADSSWHPYSHLNIFQNSAALHKIIPSYFVRHWPQLDLIASERNESDFKNLCFIGNVSNLAKELNTADWTDFVKERGLTFTIQKAEKWNDYSDVDAVIAIRDFNAKSQFSNKPSTKLINAWKAGVIFITGIETAYRFEKQGDYDYIEVTSFDDLKQTIIDLQSDQTRVKLIKSNSKQMAKKFDIEFFRGQWINLIDTTIFPEAAKHINRGGFSQLKHLNYIIFRTLFLKWHVVKKKMGFSWD